MHQISDSEEYNARVKAIIARMKPYLSKKDFSHPVYVLEDEEFIAFAMPGGNIYVSTGLIEMFPTDDKLAFAIAHELGHNENNHTYELAQLILYLEKLQERGNPIDFLEGVWAEMRAAFCNQADELESDIAAVYLLHAAGYDPERAFDVTRVLRQIDIEKPEDEVKRWIMSLAHTHPWSGDRDQCVCDYVKNAKAVIECHKVYEKGRARVTTQRKPLSVRKHPSPQSEKLGQFRRSEEIYLICDCVKQHHGLEFAYACNKKGLRGWVDKKYVQVLEE
ncbi:MAG: M48 family metalloprotease [Saprospiraceae bacterium]|nr:M48 family metalloprotease [Saprospiraceae bacterium]MDW8483331.1 M48 family metalloprotease [Saprospiraceae bacterium]